MTRQLTGMSGLFQPPPLQNGAAHTKEMQGGAGCPNSEINNFRNWDLDKGNLDKVSKDH